MYVIISRYSYSKMEATIDIEFLQGNNEQVIKEAAIVSGGVVKLIYSAHPTIWSLTVPERMD